MESLHELFPYFEKDLIEEIKVAGIEKSFQKGEIILTQENYIKNIPLITKGHIKISRQDGVGNEIVMYYIKKGETCASTIQCCENRKKSNISAEAEDEVELILIPLEYLEKWMMKYDSWKDFLLINYREKFGQMIQTLDKVAFGNLQKRLEDYLQEKSSVNKNKEITVTHQQIAYDLNSTREVISRYLKKMELRKKIKLSRGKIKLAG